MMERPIMEALVPCVKCTACCQSDAVFLHTECGDDPSQYLTREHQGKLILEHKPNGDCIYLKRGRGCMIWERRPTVCRELDCIIFLTKFTAKQRRVMIERGMLTKKMVAAAKARRQRGWKRPCPT